MEPATPTAGRTEGNTMNENRTEGTKREVSGAVKEGVGKATGDRSQEREGNLQKNVGKVQREVGEAADDVRESRNDD